MEQVQLPTKTKIAAWCMIVAGGLGIVWIFLWGFAMMEGLALLIAIIGDLILFLFIFLPGLFILKRKKWAWWRCIPFLLIPSILALLHPRFDLGSDWPYPLIFLIPFILLILDRKNFFKIAS